MKYKIHKGPMAEINVVPYIDVMLVLLIIFMVTAPLLSQGVNVQLPQASAKVLPPPPEPPIVVSIDQNGQYFLNTADQPDQAISAQQLMTQVAATLQIAKERNQQREVYVKGDRTATYGQVMQAMVLLQQAGADHVGLITEPNADPF